LDRAIGRDDFKALAITLCSFRKTQSKGVVRATRRSCQQ
jgi:hypothetical protein